MLIFINDCSFFVICLNMYTKLIKQKCLRIRQRIFFVHHRRNLKSYTRSSLRNCLLFYLYLTKQQHEEKKSKEYKISFKAAAAAAAVLLLVNFLFKK